MGQGLLPLLRLLLPPQSSALDAVIVLSLEVAAKEEDPRGVKYTL